MSLSEALEIHGELSEAVAEVVDGGLPDPLRAFATENGYDYFDTLTSDITAYLIRTGWVTDRPNDDD